MSVVEAGVPDCPQKDLGGSFYFSEFGLYLSVRIISTIVIPIIIRPRSGLSMLFAIIGPIKRRAIITIPFQDVLLFELSLVLLV